ncbi:MAG: hypothetical protein E7535_11010 [Ruminococcaceae bacterium]|nr:hypothetical protein [Oscillospiraceae bacterium]
MKNIIFGTDWWTDCDDLAALRILTRAHKNGEIRLLGIGINAAMEYSAPSVEGFLNLDGLGGIPIGIDLKATDFEGTHLKYQKNLAPFSVKYKKNEDAEDAVRLYRRLLSESGEPVHIIEVGFLQVFSALLLSGADEFSPLNGIELVKEKVEKVWVMAGKWDEEGGAEHNFCNNDRSRKAAHSFCKECPVPVTFLGFETGVNVISGSSLSENDHLYKAFRDHGSEKGRCSWDPLTALLAVIGDEERAGYKTVTGRASVDPETGRNYFKEDKNGLHKYVIPLFGASYYEEKINERIN